jgi:hypothetical protein
MRPRALFAATLIIGMWIAPQPGQALQNIRNEGWYATRIVYEPFSSWMEVDFDADVTALDAATGWTFYLTERDASAGDGDQLMQFVLAPCAPMPPPGTQVHVEVYSFGVTCTAEGRLRAVGAHSVWVAWCDASGSHICRDEDPNVVLLGSSDPEDFELVIQDESLVDGATPMPENALHCSSGTLVSSMASKTRAEPISPGTLGIYFDPDGLTCRGAVVPFTPVNLYVLIKLSGITSCGVTGAEFRILGIPASWFVNLVPLAPHLTLGNPLLNGVNVAFGGCTRGTSQVVSVYRLEVLPTTAVADLELQVVPRNPPTNELTDYPLVTLCDNGYTKARVAAHSAYLNPTGPVPCDEGLVTVQPVSWGQVKLRYR